MDCNTPGLPVSHHPPEFAYLELKKPSNLKMPMSSNKQKSLLSIAKGPGKRPPNKTKNFFFFKGKETEHFIIKLIK